ncbi:hypothetical protein HK100_002575, partial [Physocladia obscura]
AILRSTDQGDTFEITPLPFHVGGNDPGRGMGERLQVDPNKNNILFFGARNTWGLWKSIDYGVTWTNVTTFPVQSNFVNSTYFGPVGFTWIEFLKSSGTSGTATPTIFAGIALNSGQGIYESNNAGVTWSVLAGQPAVPGWFPHKCKISSDGFLYLSYSSGVGPFDGLNGTSSYYGYGGLTIDGSNPQIIMVAALNSWWPDGQIYRSTNGGASWTSIWTWNGYPTINYRYVADYTETPWLIANPVPTAPLPLYPVGYTQESLVIDPFNSDRVLYGTGGTILGTNQLTNWDKSLNFTLKPFITGVEETVPLDLISPSTGTAHLYSSVGDIGGFQHNDLAVSTVVNTRTPAFSSERSLDYAELKQNIIVRAGDVGNGGGISVSNNQGSSWFAGQVPNSANTGPGQVTVSAQGSAFVWAAKGVPVYVSTTQGSTWTVVTNLPNEAYVAADRFNDSVIYGFSAGTFYVSTNTGASFTAVTTGLPTTTSAVRPIIVLPGSQGKLYLTAGNNLYFSSNGGTAFTQVTSVASVTSITYGASSAGNTYPNPTLYLAGTVGTVTGYFISTNAAATWTRINDDAHQWGSLASVMVGDSRVYGQVFIGAGGFGIVLGNQ